jgi:branched-chain amino acid transport system substrate-binding protein
MNVRGGSMKTRQRIGAVIAAGLLVSSLAACGSDDTENDGSATAGLSGPAIKIGTLGGYSGAQASSQAGAEAVLKAWVKSVNESGGIKGHPVQLIAKDLGDNPAAGLAAVKELVEKEKVVAIVGEEDNADTTWANYISEKGIPVIGGLSLNIPFATNASFFPVGANVFALLYGELVNAKKAGDKFGFLYCAESPQCASSVALVEALSQAVGVKVPVSAKVAGNAPDYTGVCQQLKEAGVDSYTVASGAAVVTRVVRECAAAGLEAKFLNTAGAATVAWTKEPALNGAVVAQSVFPFTSEIGEGPKAYQALLAKYLPNLGDKNGPNAAEAFVAGELFRKAAEATPGEITPASLKDALWTFKGETLGGLAPPLTFVKDKPTQVNCFFTMKLEDGKFSDAAEGKAECAPDELVGGILASLG